MARYMPPEKSRSSGSEARGREPGRAPRYSSGSGYRYDDRPRGTRSGSSGYRYESSQGRTGVSGTRSRREYYKKKEEYRRKRARKRAVAVFAVIAVLASLAIIAFFIIKGLGSGTADQHIEQETAATQPETLPVYTPVTKELPKLEDNGEDGYTDGGLYIWNKKGFDIFKGDEKTALAYSEVISEFKKGLGDGINVYNMVVPNHTAYGLPDRIADGIGTNSQRDNTTVIYSNYSEQVIPVDIFNALGEKRNHYIFYNTDNRWTELGAYQAYTVFAQQAKLPPIDLNKLEKKVEKDYAGSYIKSTGNEDLKTNLDDIYYYTLPGKYSCTVIQRSTDGTLAEKAEKAALYKTKLDEGEDGLDIIAYGDNPLYVADNESNTSGEKLLLVKDTFGNGLIPFLAASYDEVHVIDFRYYEGSIKDYCNKKGIKNVLFVNGIMSANSAAQINKMAKLQ